MPDTSEKADPLAELIERLRAIVTTLPANRPAGKPWDFAEGADYLGISSKHPRYLADVGKVASIKLGERRRLIPDREIRRIEKEGI